PRAQSITKVAFVKDRVFVAGLSNEEWASNLRSIPFPFTQVDKGASIQIYHGAHGRFETAAPIRTFAPYEINGQAHLRAACMGRRRETLPSGQLHPGAKVKGTTVAGRGNRNVLLEMVIYEKTGKDYVRLSNSSFWIMKTTTENVGNIQGITDPVRGGGTA